MHAANRRSFSLVATFCLAAGLAACAEGTSEPTGSTSGGGDSSGGNGGNGGAGDGGSSSTSTSSSTKASSTASTSTGQGGAGGSEGGCGNNVCDEGETCASCPNDCTESCGPTCGDGSCNGAETCQTCPDDCNACTGVCGDGVCEDGEQASCPQDCSASSSGGGNGCPANACAPGGNVDFSTCMNDCVIFACFADEACCMGPWTQSCADAATLAYAFGACNGC